MKIKLSYLLILFILPLLQGVQAQTATFKWGPEFDAGRTDELNELIYDDGTYYYMYVKDKKETGHFYFIQGILQTDHQFNIVKRQNYTKFHYPAIDLGIVYLKDKFICLYVVNNKDMKFLYGQQVNKSTLQPEGEVKKLLSIETYNGGYVWNYMVSNDSTKLLVTGSGNEDKNTKQTVFLGVYGSDLNKLLEKSVTTEFTFNDLDYNQFQVANNGDVYLSSKGRTEPAEKKKEKETKLYVYLFRPDGTDRKIIFENYKHIINHATIHLDASSGNLITAGTFQNENSKKTSGYFISQLNPTTLEVINYKEYLLAANLINAIRGNDGGKDNNGIDETYRFTDFNINNESQLTGILENNYEDEVSNEKSTYLKECSKGMIVFRHDKEANQLWIKYIPKNQEFNPQIQRHVTLFTGEKVIILFNDNVANNNLAQGKEPEVTRMNKSASLIQVTLNADGKITRKELLNYGNDDLILRTQRPEKGFAYYTDKLCSFKAAYSKQISENTIFLNANIDKNFIYKLGLMTIK